MRWLKNPSTNKPDTMLTITALASLIVLLKFLFSGMEIYGLKFEALDAGVVGAILTPTLGAYVARRWKDTNVTKTNIDKD